MIMRHRLSTARSPREQLLAEAKERREEAKLLPPGPTRDAVLKKARQVENAADEWASSRAQGRNY